MELKIKLDTQLCICSVFFLIGVLFTMFVHIYVENDKGMDDMSAGFCYGKEGMQFLPFAEITNIYQKGNYGLNLTRVIDCSVFKGGD